MFNNVSLFSVLIFKRKHNINYISKTFTFYFANSLMLTGYVKVSLMSVLIFMWKYDINLVSSLNE